jgi:hypothetical protein
MASSIVVLQTYSIPEAVVASSMLEAYGFAPVVADYHFVHQSWARIFAVQGLRVMVPEVSAKAARCLLVPIDPKCARQPVGSLADKLAAIAFFVALGGVIFPFWLNRKWDWSTEDATLPNDEDNPR